MAVAAFGKHMVDRGKSVCIACRCAILVLETSKRDKGRDGEDTGMEK